MQTAQTQFIGLGNPFASDAFFSSVPGVGSIPGNGAMTVMAMILPTAVDAEGDEWLFGNLTGLNGFVILRMGSDPTVYNLTAGFGTGAAVVAVGIDMAMSQVVGHPLFVAYTYDGEGNYAGYLNGELITTVSDDPFTSDSAAFTYGAGGANNPFASLGIAVGLGYRAWTATEIFAYTALAMKAHNMPPADFDHLWSSQNDALRETPAILLDRGAGTTINLLQGGDVTPNREVWDTQFGFPFGTEPEPPDIG